MTIKDFVMPVLTLDIKWLPVVCLVWGFSIALGKEIYLEIKNMVKRKRFYRKGIFG